MCQTRQRRPDEGAADIDRKIVEEALHGARGLLPDKRSVYFHAQSDCGPVACWAIRRQFAASTICCVGLCLSASNLAYVGSCFWFWGSCHITMEPKKYILFSQRPLNSLVSLFDKCPCCDVFLPSFARLSGSWGGAAVSEMAEPMN